MISHAFDGPLCLALPHPNAQVIDPIGQIVGELRQKHDLAWNERVFVGGENGKASDDRTVAVAQGKCAHRTIASLDGFFAPRRKRWIAPQFAAD